MTEATLPLPETAGDDAWVVGPFARGEADVDEALIIFRAFKHAEHSAGTMIDVGAHRGSSLGPFARAGWRVFGFEPDPLNRSGLMAGAGAMANVHIDHRPVSNTDGTEVTFYRSEESTGVSGLNPFLSSHEALLTANTVSLSSFAFANTIDQVDFLKIDVEGHDFAVLQGFPWKQCRPLAVLTEFEDSKTGDPGAAARMCGFLQSLGYDVYVSEWHEIIRYGISHDFRGLWKLGRGQAPSDAPWGNLIAVGPELVGPLVSAARSSV